MQSTNPKSCDYTGGLCQRRGCAGGCQAMALAVTTMQRAQTPTAPAALRLTDAQWINIVNHAHCYRDIDKEQAVALAVKLTEARMAMNAKPIPSQEG